MTRSITRTSRGNRTREYRQAMRRAREGAARNGFDYIVVHMPRHHPNPAIHYRAYHAFPASWEDSLVPPFCIVAFVATEERT